MKYHKIFEVQKDITTYKYPLIKLVICLFLVLSILIVSACDIIRVPFIIRIVFVVLIGGSYLSGLISVGEIAHVYFKKKGKRSNKEYCREIRTIDIVKLVKENDIIEINAKINKKIITFGSASECERNGFNFFNKVYYIGKQEFKDIKSFENNLKVLFPNDIIYVFKIDGVSPYKYNIDDLLN